MKRASPLLCRGKGGRVVAYRDLEQGPLHEDYVLVAAHSHFNWGGFLQMTTRIAHAVRSFVVMTMFASTALSSHAALQGTTTVIANLRIEGTYGFVGFAQSMPACGERVWLDMNSVIGRATYATAMLAFSTGKLVTVRADDQSTRVFGACNLYDIYVSQ